MSDTKFHEIRSGGESSRQAGMYSPNLQPLMQSLLATLADIDFEYEREREKLSSVSRDANLRIRVLEKLRAQHRERRDPYIQQLAAIQSRIMASRAL